MMRWTPTTGNGWYPFLNYPWVAYGFGECWVSNMVTGETRRIRPDVRCQPAGWLDAETLAFYTGEFPATVYAIYLRTNAVRELGSMPVNRVLARAGSWATGLASGGTVTQDGRVLASGVGWRIDLDGPILACGANDGLHVWVNGSPQPVVAPKATLVDPRVSGERVGYGYNGPVRLYDVRTGNDDDVTVTPWQKEHAPVVVDEWIWTTTEKPDGTSAAVGRPIGDRSCLVLSCASAVYLDVQRIDNEWVVATSGTRGELLVQSIAVDAPRALLSPADPPQVPVSVPPAPAHLKGCGYFFRDTNIHAYLAKYGSENPSAPGTHSVIVDDHGMPAETRADGTTPRMIIGLSQLLHPQLPLWWDRVDAVYVAVENDEAGLERYAAVARYLMRELGLSPKPILSYSAGSVFPLALDEDDILGIQFYAPRGEGPDYFRRLAAEVWPRIRDRKRVAIIGQAYDRGGWFTGAELAALQPVLYEVACAWPNCEYLLWFSDARTGGTRDHEEMRPWHTAIADAISRIR
jgi:hypothetical protein